jgi:diaphanous 1
MKSLFWEIIPAKDIKDTLWDELDDTKIKINLDKFEEKFSQVKKEPKKAVVEKKTPAKKEKKTFLEPDRTRMMSIVLNKIRIDTLELSDAIEQYDLKILTPEVCGLLLPILPNEAEVKEVSAFQGDIMEELAVCDQFVLIISGIAAFKERIKAIIFQYNYLSDYMIVMEEINRIFKVFKFMKEDKNLKRLFEIILALGNYMNGGSFRGGSFGFTLASLTKLADTKSSGITFVDYIVKFIYEQIKEPGVLGIVKDLKEFDKLQYQSIVESSKQMENRWKDVLALKKALAENKDILLDEDKSEKFLSSFYDDAEKKIKEIKESVEKIDKDYLDLAKYYGENPEKFTMVQFVDTFRKFTKELSEAQKKYLEKAKKKKK